MKTSLIKKYFDDNWFLNHVFAAIFRHNAEWEFNEMAFVAGQILIDLKAPKMRGTLGHLKVWIQSGLAILESREGKNFVRPGCFHNGMDVRECSDIPEDILNAVESAVQSTRRFLKYAETFEVKP